MDDASNGAIDKAAEALQELAKQSSILEDSVKDNIKANKQAPRELAKVMDRLEKQGDALIAAQKKYRDTLKQIQARQAAAQKAAAGSLAAERKAKADALRAERAANRELKKQFTDLGLSAQNAAGKIDALAAEAKANKATIQKVATDLSKPSAKLGKGLDMMHSKVQNSISGLGKFSAVMALAKKAVTELYGQSIRLANKGMVGSMAQMNISAMKLRMTAEEFEGLVSANREVVALMGGGAQGIENFQAVLNESSVGLEYLGKEGKKAAATIMAGFNRAGFGLMSSNADISSAYQNNIKGLNKQFKMFNGVFGDTVEQFTNLYEQQLKGEALQAKLLSGDTRGLALQMKEVMVRTETLKLMGLNNEQVIAMSKRVDALFNPKENRQGEAMSERVSARQALASGAQMIKGEDPELAAKIDSFVKSGEMAKFQQMSTEDKKAYMVQNAELFKGVSKMEQMIAAQRDRDGGDTSTRGMVFTDRAKAAGGEYSSLSMFGKDLNQAQAQGYDQSPEGRMKLAAKGFENVMSDVNGETTALGKAFGKLRDSVESVTSLLNNPFTTALTAIGAALLFSSTTIRAAVAGAAESVMATAKMMAGSVRGLFKGLLAFIKKFSVLSSIFGGIEGAYDAYNTDTDDYYKRTGINRKATVVPQFMKDLGVRALGTMSDVGSSTMKALSFGMYDRSKDFADKQDAKQTAGMTVPSATKLPHAAGSSGSGSTTPYDFNKYAAALGKRESGNNYGIVNSLGYAGKYQFGAAALVDLGYVKRGTTNRGLRDPANWNIPGGLDAFLADPKLQEDAFKAYTDAHYQQLLNAKVITPSSSPSEIAGYLATAHLKGIGGAIDLKKGKNGTDAYGTTASSYYSLGVGTQGTQAPFTGAPQAQMSTPQMPQAAAGATSTGMSEVDQRRALIAKAQQASPTIPSAAPSAGGGGNPVVDELKQQTGLLGTMVALLGKTEASRRGYQMDQQTGMSVAT